jgi:hypothetical protein
MWESHECSLRQTAAILANMGMRDAVPVEQRRQVGDAE